MALHKSLGETGYLWAIPGGGMIFGQSAEKNLEREFLEETGLKIRVDRFLFVNEYLNAPLHAIELFFEVTRQGGILKTGTDPEMGKEGQILEKIVFLGPEELEKIERRQLHCIFWDGSGPENIIQKNGFYYNGIKGKIG